ncbi:hypothetical protein QE450_002943 [Paenibacillus sp. SORGH_AS306]|nr:hypothetical protein [Paenibacillus sp. SORGH_AS_0306]MDR6112494.1 hypothetical protein [Paenibacillus sp. SORGH_AS_0338]
MFNIRRVMYKIGGALLAVLFVLTLASPVFATADTDQESPFKVHLSDVEVKDQNAVPPDTTTDTAIPPGDSTNPDGTNQNGINQNGTNQGQNQSSDPNQQGNTQTPDNGQTQGNQTGGTSTNSTHGNGTTMPNSTESNGVVTPLPSTPSPTPTGGTQVDGTNTDGTSVDKPNPAKADQQGNEQVDNRPWYEQWWDKGKEIVANPVESLQNFGKGAAAGAIGAGAVILAAVVIFSVILSAPISVPVLIVAGVVGIIAGGIYGLLAGDNFEFVKGIGYGALGAISIIGIAQSGVVGAVRGGWTFFRSQGTKLFFKEASKRSWGYLKGFGRGLWDSGRSLISSPIQTIKSAITSKAFKASAIINISTGFFNKMAFDGIVPDFKDMGIIFLEGLAGALIFDKVTDIFKSPAGSQFGKSVSGFFGSMVESLSMTRIKTLIDPDENKNLAQQGTTSFLNSMVLSPIFGRVLKNVRTNNGITTTTSDLEEKGIEVSQSNVGGKSITHRQLDMIWNDTANKRTVERWQNNHNNSLTQAQYDRLLDQEKALQSIKNPLDITQKVTEQSVEKGSEWLSNDKK